MSLALAVVIFFGLTLVLAILPFLPGLIEWRTKTDAEPLPVEYDSEVNIRHFAMGFRSFIETYLSAELAACRETGGLRDGTLGDGSRYIVISNGGMPILTESEMRHRSAGKLIFSCGDLHLPDEMLFLYEIYAGRSVQGGDGNVYRAILAEDNIHLGRETMSLRWLHAGGSVHADSGGKLYGRVSADERIRLDGYCRFERLNAPRIEFDHVPESAGSKESNNNNDTRAGVRPRRLLRPEEVPHLVEVAAGRWQVERKLEIPPGVWVETNLVVTGWARIYKDVRIIGSIKSHKDMYLYNGVEVRGSAVSGRNLYIGAGCLIHGPVIAEKDVYINRGSVIGSMENPTTVSARNIFVAHGTIAHGTVWAHTKGELSSMSESI
ncbi:MAG: hypothetical protein GTO42_02685 [Candidatus Latescibacteria bacterium]|nr:hypothetical protein [Candidatus Latescibacterota bacterium]NIO01044.1 hypothetical protein [Candidatus Latescibacterota bacterium]NIO27443.1 hypothetical protein [Candidatus Latescibacterota bacterium]NIO54965.1 hypothetical protein [Candidatus Latescibacterota bacterium]NIT01054.1 hypothetical protein [Candidatus Latescibacterota bacterium]